MSEHEYWAGEDTSVGDVAAQLDRMRIGHFRDDHRHAAARTMNLVLAPGAEPPMLVHHPARVITLRQHSDHRLDGEIAFTCAVSNTPGRVGACYETITLTADRARLEHADSLVRRLLVCGIPTVVRLGGSGPADPSLRALAEERGRW